ncbi:hypothetical protein T4D_122 [Trichinella pseudospiralis]|uniref:Uncharacterized protein n=1 Tax=Trichinella pseudospiralis TaxID=6337 RepID=A0A0V1F5M0_TRIPS|nr:hypothetical protein T4D_122 [Trichinella pseudospiralis]
MESFHDRFSKTHSLHSCFCMVVVNDSSHRSKKMRPLSIKIKYNIFKSTNQKANIVKTACAASFLHSGKLQCCYQWQFSFGKEASPLRMLALRMIIQPIARMTIYNKTSTKTGLLLCVHLFVHVHTLRVVICMNSSSKIFVTDKQRKSMLHFEQPAHCNK